MQLIRQPAKTGERGSLSEFLKVESQGDTLTVELRNTWLFKNISQFQAELDAIVLALPGLDE